jgi:GMP synthase (glutamine-hydrolysing)
MKQQDTKQTVLVVDFGSQVTQLIARRVREHGVHSEVVPFDKSEAALLALKPRALILSGGPSSTYAEKAPRAPEALFKSWAFAMATRPW